MQGFIIEADGVGETPLDGIGGHFCPVESALDINALIHIGINPHAKPDTVIGQFFSGKPDGGVFEDLLIIRAVGAVDHKSVRLATGDNPSGFLNDLPEFFSDSPEDLIAVSLSVALVEHAEVVYIHHHGIRCRVFMELVKLFGVAEEEFLVVKAGQQVSLGRFQRLSVFMELNGSLHSRENNAGGGIGLRDKISRTQLQTLDLRLLFGSEHDNRDGCERGILPDGFQNLRAGLDGHQQIQQHKRQRVSVLVHHFQCLCPVAGKEHLIVRFQNCAENLPVDEFIICYQDKPFSVG